MRDRVTFRAPAQVSDGAGGFIPGYADAGTAAAEYQPVSASRVVDADSTEVMNRAQIWVRGQAVPEAFNQATWRINAKSADRVVLSMTDQDGDGRFVTFIVGLAS